MHVRLLHAIQVSEAPAADQRGEIVINSGPPSSGGDEDSDGDDSEYGESEDDAQDSDDSCAGDVERVQRGSEDDFIVVDSESEVGMSEFLRGCAAVCCVRRCTVSVAWRAFACGVWSVVFCGNLKGSLLYFGPMPQKFAFHNIIMTYKYKTCI